MSAARSCGEILLLQPQVRPGQTDDQQGGSGEECCHWRLEMFISACTFQKLSVPTLSPSHLQPSHHSPVQVSRSVPSQLGQAWQPHRKLSRAGLSSSQSGQKFRPDKISVWSRERDQHGGKRRKQDLNRSVRVRNVSQDRKITSSYRLSGTFTTITMSLTKTVCPQQRAIPRIIFMRR